MQFNLSLENQLTLSLKRSRLNNARTTILENAIRNNIEQGGPTNSNDQACNFEKRLRCAECEKPARQAAANVNCPFVPSTSTFCVANADKSLVALAYT